jgi:hypothetical protein
MVTFLVASIVVALVIVCGVKLNTYLYRNGALKEVRQPGLQEMIFGLEAE